MLGFSLLQYVVALVTLGGIALPFWRITARRHARAYMAVLVGLTTIWYALYVYLHSGVLVGHVTNNPDRVLLRAYAFNGALCCLVDEILSIRDEASEVRPTVLGGLIAFFLVNLILFVGGMSGAF